MKGQILDVYPEGGETFRACVLEVIGGGDELAVVVNLDTGEKLSVKSRDCWLPIIDNVFEL